LSWRCPVCRDGLHREEFAWRCSAGHSYDVAREGYVNLLVTHQRRKREPGDSAEMVRARRAFLDGGWYSPLREALTELVPQDGAVLDVGCGEGYYSRNWPMVWALDIAKAAVRAAARRGRPGLEYAVASAYDLPVLDASVSSVVSVFAPVVSAEFRRVLPVGGLLATATPGPDHLSGLKRHLFTEPERHPSEGPLDRAGPASGFEPLAPLSTRVRYEIELPEGPAVGDLLGMTPYAWYVGPEDRERVASLPGLVTTVDFLVSAYRAV
jgi:23S rRNA (guanine745-N1)-methyltransferase